MKTEGTSVTQEDGESTVESGAMRRCVVISVGVALAFVLGVHGWALGGDIALEAPATCRGGVAGGVNCIVSKQDQKQAQKAFERGVKLHRQQHIEEALKQFEEAAHLVPQNAEYLTAREVVKGKLVFDHLQRGNALLAEDARVRAATEFRAALDLDPGNEFARERFQEATRTLPALVSTPAALPDSEEIHLDPADLRATFHFSGDSRSLFTELGAAYKITVQFDDSVQSRPVRFNVDNVSFFEALQLACQVSKTMWAALDAHQMLIAADNPESHKQFDRMSLRTLVLPPRATPQETTDLVNAMRNMFELRFISSGQTANTVEVRGPQSSVEACARLLAQLSNPRPQVMIDIRVYQISHSLTRDIGVHIPNTFNLYNIPAFALLGLGGTNIQDLINQLIASGAINQAGSTSLAGLLAQLTGQQSSIFSQPLATFGGGLTLMGLSLDHFAAQLSLNESWARTLDDLSMRAGQGTEANFHLGQRYPIMNASYSPIYNSPQIAQVLGNQSYIPPVPSVTYEDLGLNVKATPTIHGDGSVTLKLEMQVRSLTGQSANGVPVISNREYKGSIHLNDGEPAFVAGEISQNDMKSMGGIPGFGMIPGLNLITTTNNKQENNDELMIAITPHVVSNFSRESNEIWMSQK